MERVLFERAALTSALSTYLTNAGWTGITYKEGYQIDDTISVPLISVHFLPSGPDSLQLGGSSEKLFTRIVQFTCYMDNEPRAMSIGDLISDFADTEAVYILDKLNGDAVIGTLMSDTESIYIETVPPNLVSTKVNRWRAIVRVTYEAHYY